MYNVYKKAYPMSYETILVIKTNASTTSINPYWLSPAFTLFLISGFAGETNENLARAFVSTNSIGGTVLFYC